MNREWFKGYFAGITLACGIFYIAEKPYKVGDALRAAAQWVDGRTYIPKTVNGPWDKEDNRDAS